MKLENTIKTLKEKLTFKNIKEFCVNTFNKIKNNKWVRFVVYLYFVAFIMFFFTLVNNNFTIPISGDFSLQQIPFYFNGYDDWWTAIKTGQFVMWDDSAMLGVNNIGANSFYYLFNPFFLVLLIFPRSMMPQAQAFMMITKMVLAGVAMKILLNYFKVKEETSSLIGLAYAFCGWNLYYLWFNHFLEITVLMPLFLLGIEKVLKERNPVMLIYMIFITGLTNYFFLIAFCFCGVMYAIFRYFQLFKEYKEIESHRKIMNYGKHLDIRWEVILKGFFAFLTGLLLTCSILFPCFSVVLENSRVTSQTYLTSLTDSLSAFSSMNFFDALGNLFNVLFKWENYGEKYVLYPLIAFFMPNASCFDSILLRNNSYDNTYASLFIYSPLLLMFIPSLINSFKTRKISVIVAMSGLCLLLFTPFAYYCFSGFTSVAYGRWYIFVTAIAFVFVGVQYDKREEMPVWPLDISIAIIVLLYGYLLYKGDYFLDIKMNNIKEMDERKYYIYGELIYLIILYFYLRKNYKKPKLTENLSFLIAAEAIIMCNITLSFIGINSYSTLYKGQDNITEEMSIAETIKSEDDDYYRVFSSTLDRSANNCAMMLGTPGMSTFHSVYNYNLEDFLSWSEVQYKGRGQWSMGVHEKRIYLDQFLGTKYYLLKTNDNNIPFGFDEYLTTDDHIVYVNNNFIELGYAFDNVILTQQIDNYFDDEVINKGVITYPQSPYTGSDGKTYYSNYLSADGHEILTNEYSYLKGAIMYEEDIIDVFGEDYLNSTDFNFILTEEDLNQDLKVVNNSVNSDGDYTKLANDDITVYYANWKDGKFVDKPENYSNEGKYGATVTRTVDYGNGKVETLTTNNYKGLTWNSYLDIDVSKCNIGGKCDSRGRCFVTVNARLGENLSITLYGGEEGNEHIITSDQHGKHNFNKIGDRKRLRGFYVDEKVNRIVIKVLDTFDKTTSILKPYITYQYEDDYNEIITELKNSPLENVKKDVNSFEFDTNFDKDKMIVLQIPYDQGWSLKKYQNNKYVEDVELYKGQGGFLAFYGEAGDYHYVVSYYTPYLSTGLKVMTIGVSFVSFYYLGTTLLTYDKKRIIRDLCGLK